MADVRISQLGVEVEYISENNIKVTQLGVEVEYSVNRIDVAKAIAYAVIIPDTIPDSFTFIDITDADLDTVYTSNQITVAGISVETPVSITGGTYSKNGGGYTASAGTCVTGTTFTVRTTSSSNTFTAVNVVLDIGGITDTYTVTTGAGSSLFFCHG